MSMMGQQLSFDFRNPAPAAPSREQAHEDGRRARVERGALGHRAGLSAEARVAQDYERRGYRVARRRWRGRCGEIDLILHDGAGLIFVEVKKSRSFDRALQRLSSRQIARLLRAGEEFAGTQPLGSLTEMRFDVALMNEQGMIRVMENALGP
ncbi:YraN family protein [Salipiger bermudensis]|uniref:YraN family protein n=1 Tax=Salipiger bermudensis TaxID=344736 RepID=UPI001C994090|nr:YraN family protein [Salipiger bermudensis]MBY6002563.1 YraN family protein [Salipiger bermudensis]